MKRIKNYDKLFENYERLVGRTNSPVPESNGIITRYQYPIITADHIPVNWRYDLNQKTNPFGLERIGVNAAFNAGAIKWKGKYLLAVRVEGSDRKSFFAFAESENGIDNFRFWEKPLVLPQNDEPDINAYDLRLVAHEDGYIYGIFCAERKDPSAQPYDTVSAVAKAGIIRSRDLKQWERLPNLICGSAQQRNVTLHPEFINGKYALYTRPQDGFIDTGSGGGIGLGYISDMSYPVLEDERIINPRRYHTIYEMKNGQGPSPLKTPEGWLHLAHGVRNTAAGLRYVLYAFMTDLEEIDKVIYQPGGYLMAPNAEEIIGDVGNVLFCNGWIADEDGKVYIYYASSDSRMHIATSSLEVLVNYCKHTPEDGMNTTSSVESIMALIEKNKGLMTM
ncbi:glycoside hydrolase family 130 protein [Poritiphilus flavus]